MSDANRGKPLHPALEGAGIGAILTVTVFPLFVIVVYLAFGRQLSSSPADVAGIVTGCFVLFLLPVLISAGFLAGLIVVLGRGRTIARVTAAVFGIILPATVYTLIQLRLAESDIDVFAGMCAMMIDYFLLIALPAVAITTAVRGVVPTKSP